MYLIKRFNPKQPYIKGKKNKQNLGNSFIKDKKNIKHDHQIMIIQRFVKKYVLALKLPLTISNVKSLSNEISDEAFWENIDKSIETPEKIDSKQIEYYKSCLREHYENLNRPLTAYEKALVNRVLNSEQKTESFNEKNKDI